MPKANKVSVYLIKDTEDIDSFLKEQQEGISLCGGRLFFNSRPISKPKWVKDFFDDNEAIIDTFKVASAQALFAKSVDIGGQSKLFAISFGSGYHMIKKSAIVPNFGLKIVLNTIDETRIKKIDTHSIASVPKHKSEQVTKVGELREFSVNYETDILTGITGSIDKKTQEELYDKFGINITGKDSLSASIKFNADTIEEFLITAYSYYNSDEYKVKGFGWIDNIQKVSNKDSLYDRLNENLDTALAHLEDYRDKIWLAVPEIINWEQISGFYYGTDKENLKEDLSLSDIECDLSVETLRSIRVCALEVETDRNAYEWSALDCLYAEIEFDNEIYMFINSNWYKIDMSFKDRTNQKFQENLERPCPNIAWVNYSQGQAENIYNIALSGNIPRSICLDAKNIQYGGGHSQVELCDVFDVEGHSLICVKKYAGSAVLSHLFNQGYVSANLLYNDQEFRNAALNKIREQQPEIVELPNVENIVFVVLSNKTDESSQNLPFFSKLTLNRTIEDINRIKGYNAFIKIIPAG